MTTVERAPAPRFSANRVLRSVITHGILLTGAWFMLFPFAWMILTSFKEQIEATRYPPTIFPAVWHPENYLTAWEMVPWTRYFLNTILVGVATTVLVLITASLAAYAFARLKFRGKNPIFVIFLMTMMIPGEVTLIPNFVIISWLQWYNTYFALIVPFATSVFAVFLLRQFFLSIPNELFDAAKIDGCGDFQFFRQIALPLARPALFTIGLLTILGTWNALLWPLIVTRNEDMRLLQVGLSAFRGEASTLYHLQMAASTFTMLPVLVVYFFLQRQFIETMASSGVKG